MDFPKLDSGYEVRIFLDQAVNSSFFLRAFFLKRSFLDSRDDGLCIDDVLKKVRY